MRTKTVKIGLLIILAAVLLAAGCAKQQASTGNGTSSGAAPSGDQSTTPTTAPRPINVKADKVALFDLSHGEIFHPDDGKDLGYSQAGDIFRMKGYEIKTLKKGPITEAALSGVNALVIAGPMKEFTKQEIDTISKFVGTGGDVLVTVHVPEPVIPLAERFGYMVSTFAIGQIADSFDGSVHNFIAPGIGSHPITEGMSGVAVRKSYALKAITGTAAAGIVSSASTSWSDEDPDEKRGQFEATSSFVIIGASTHGQGKFVLIADDAVFTNKTIGISDNRKFCENIAAWFAQP